MALRAMAGEPTVVVNAFREGPDAVKFQCIEQFLTKRTDNPGKLALRVDLSAHEINAERLMTSTHRNTGDVQGGWAIRGSHPLWRRLSAIHLRGNS